MSRFWSEGIAALTPYVPGEQPKLKQLVKLNTNEHPFGPSPKALAAIQAAVNDDLRLYPDPSAEQLRAALAQRFGTQPDHIFVGNGSDEVLAFAFQSLLRHADPVWFPDITYSFYPVYCGLYGVTFRKVPLDAEFRLRVEDYLPRNTERAGGIIFANPNAPTGIALSLAEVERIVAGNPHCVVLVDEAYIDFGGDSAASLVSRYPNLLVVHTFSKSRSLAGLRVGYAIGQPELIEALDRVKNSFNSYPLDRLALAGAVASVEDETWFTTSCQRVMDIRTQLVADLNALGFEVLPSTANFVFARHPQQGGAQLAQALRERAIIVRHFNQARIEDFLRITVGTEEQCASLVSALREILG